MYLQGRIQKGGIDFASRTLSLKEPENKIKKNTNIMVEIKANALDRYLIVISTLWHC